MAIQKAGRDLWANALSNANNGFAGTAASFTSVTVKVTGAGWTVNAFAGQDVYTAGVVGTILSNTSEVLTIARWETPGARGGAAAATPAGTPSTMIASGMSPAQWMALTANAEAPSVGGADTELPGEIKTSEGGLIRKLATFAHTTGTNTYTLTATFTVNNKDAVPVKLAKLGILNAQNGGKLLFETLLSAVAEVKSENDSVTITDTVEGT